MKPRITSGLVLTAALVLATGTLPVSSGSRADARGVARRGLAFLERDAAKWRAERQCSSCHQGTMTVLAYVEAQSRGYALPPDAMADAARWTKERLLRTIDLPRDPRPGWSMVSTPALYLALMARSVPGQQAVTADELGRIGGHLVRHQEADGSWSWASAPPKNRPPPVFESDAVATLLGLLALGPKPPAKTPEDPAVRETRMRAEAWLAASKAADSTQSAALRLLLKARAAKSGRAPQRDIEEFLARQNSDGGWSQADGFPSDAYATGQAVYLLQLAGMNPDRTAIRRAVAYLAAGQRADGSWPMTPRSHPGATPMTNPGPIVYSGSAWATLGLMRALDPPPAARAGVAGSRLFSLSL